MKVIKVLVKNNSLIVEELYQKNFEDSDNIMYFTLKYIKYNKDCRIYKRTYLDSKVGRQQ